jgi:hypothetical protein
MKINFGLCYEAMGIFTGEPVNMDSIGSFVRQWVDEYVKEYHKQMEQQIEEAIHDRASLHLERSHQPPEACAETCDCDGRKRLQDLGSVYYKPEHSCWYLARRYGDPAYLKFGGMDTKTCPLCDLPLP